MTDLSKESLLKTLAAEEEPRPIQWRDEIEDVLGGVIMALLLGVMALQIFSRYVFGAPLVGTEEAARYLYIAIVFVCVVGAVYKRGHIAIEIFVGALPRRGRIVLRMLADALTLGFLGLLVYWGARSTLRVWGTPSPALEMNMGYLYALVPLSAFLMILRLLQLYLTRRANLDMEQGL